MRCGRKTERSRETRGERSGEGKEASAADAAVERGATARGQTPTDPVEEHPCRLSTLFLAQTTRVQTRSGPSSRRRSSPQRAFPRRHIAASAQTTTGRRSNMPIARRENANPQAARTDHNQLVGRRGRGRRRGRNRGGAAKQQQKAEGDGRGLHGENDGSGSGIESDEKTECSPDERPVSYRRSRSVRRVARARRTRFEAGSRGAARARPALRNVRTAIRARRASTRRQGLSSTLF